MIPGINSTCNRSIIGWTIDARWTGLDGDCDSYPYLLIWRSPRGDGYTLEDSTRLLVSDNGCDNGDYIFTEIPDPPMEFQVGDVHGIF